MDEFTYTAKQAKGKAFIHTELTRSDVHISKGLDYLTLSLERSKMDRENQGVNIIVAATGDAACPVTLLRHLYKKDLQPRDAPLFRFNTRTFHRATVVKALHARLECLSINTKCFLGHSFRKGATQHAHDSGLLNEQIETLGRWSSDAFQLYYKASPRRLFELNRQFQSGRPLRISPAFPPTIPLINTTELTQLRM